MKVSAAFHSSFDAKDLGRGAAMRTFAANALAFHAFVHQWLFDVVVPEYPSPAHPQGRAHAVLARPRNQGFRLSQSSRVRASPS